MVSEDQRRRSISRTFIQSSTMTMVKKMIANEFTSVGVMLRPLCDHCARTGCIWNGCASVCRPDGGLNTTHANAPSSWLVPPVQVMVTLPDVVRVAVVWQ